jgi:transposase
VSINPKQYTAEFKQEAVRLARELGYVAQAAGDLGIHGSMFHRWKNLLAEQGDATYPGNGRLRNDAAVIRQLRREREILRRERERLQTTLRICAVPRSSGTSSWPCTGTSIRSCASARSCRFRPVPTMPSVRGRQANGMWTQAARKRMPSCLSESSPVSISA